MLENILISLIGYFFFLPFELVIAIQLIFGIKPEKLFTQSCMEHFKRDGYIHFEFLPGKFRLR
jgi:hypothetical protein